MDTKSINTLEFDHVLDRLAEYAAFSLSAELARSLKPTNDLELAHKRLQLTTEARYLLSVNSDISIGAARNILGLVDLANRGGVLEPSEILEIRDTLISSRDLFRQTRKYLEQIPNLSEITNHLAPPDGLIDAINKIITDRGEIMDQASPELLSIRKEMKICRSRLVEKLNKFINNPSYIPLLQEQIVTQRNNRYVIPLKSDFKGRIKGIIHDQSSSGATLFVEPQNIVETNNDLQELQLNEKNEVRRILASISEQIGQEISQINLLVSSIAKFDLSLMCAKYAEDLKAIEPILIPFKNKKGLHPGSQIKLINARHPLLDFEKAVPIDVDLEEDIYSVIITGPNTGGKTVTLKTIGLLVLMAQSGLHIPAQSGSTLTIFNNVYADIGDEQSIEQSLSTFSGHIKNIVRIIKQCDSKSLILLDELGAGTDPQEGATLAQSILKHFINKPTTCFIATHYPELKIFAHSTNGVINASLEFDPQTLSPTYRLTIGLPGRSNALLIAKRLGLPESILADARNGISADELKAEDLLDDIHKQRERAFQEYERAQKERIEIEHIKEDLNSRLNNIETERQKILEDAQDSAYNSIAEIKEEIRTLRKSLSYSNNQPQDISELNTQVKSIEKKLESKFSNKNIEPLRKKQIEVGKKVELRKLGLKGKITAIDDNEIEVLAGSLRVKVHPEDILSTNTDEFTQNLKTRTTVNKPSKTSSMSILHTSPGIEINLRGKRVDEALDELEKHIERAYLANVPFIRIIHGKGTGRLREAVRSRLKNSEFIKKSKTAEENEGGTGATIAYLVDS